MRKILIPILLAFTFNSFAQPGVIKPLLGRDSKVYPDTSKSSNISWPLYWLNDSTAAIKQDTISASGSNMTLSATAKILMGLSAGVYDITNNRIGIGTTSPSYAIEIVKNTSGAERIRLINSSSGTTAQGLFDISNGTSAAQFGIVGTGFTTSGLLTAGTVYLQANGGAGTTRLVLQSTSTNPILFGINSAETWRISSTGLLSNTGADGTAYLTLKAGTASANSAPLKFTSGTNLTTAVAGAVEYDGTSLYFSPSTTRKIVTLSLAGSATLDFGSIAAAGNASLTITVTGAAVGDVVDLGVPNGSMTAGLVFTAWVSATNTVSVQCYNSTAGAIDPASGTFKARAIQ